MPIFIMRQFVRHRTFRINEASLRYTESTDDFYIPTTWRKQDLKSKQSSFIDEDWNLVKNGETNHEFFAKLLRFVINILRILFCSPELWKILLII